MTRNRPLDDDEVTDGLDRLVDEFAVCLAPCTVGRRAELDAQQAELVTARLTETYREIVASSLDDRVTE